MCSVLCATFILIFAYPWKKNLPIQASTLVHMMITSLCNIREKKLKRKKQQWMEVISDVNTVCSVALFLCAAASSFQKFIIRFIHDKVLPFLLLVFFIFYIHAQSNECSILEKKKCLLFAHIYTTLFARLVYFKMCMSNRTYQYEIYLDFYKFLFYSSYLTVLLQI